MRKIKTYSKFVNLKMTNIIPQHKSDIHACERMVFAANKDIIAVLPQLLEWLKDINWPVASHIINRIKGLGADLNEPINEILMSEDGAWKYWVLTNLLPRADVGVTRRLLYYINNLMNHPTHNDQIKEVDIAAKDLLIGFGLLGELFSIPLRNPICTHSTPNEVPVKSLSDELGIAEE